MVAKRWKAVMAGLLAGVLLAAAGAWADPPPVAYVALKYRLVRQGLNKEYVLKTFADPRNQFMPAVVKKIAHLRKESPDIYRQFLTPAVVAKGRAYMKDHQAVLDQAETRFGVAPQVIVAILTVESGLGSNTGKYPVFNVFASLAVMDQPEVIKEVGLQASPARLKKKAAWARRELAIFLKYCAAHHQDPFSLCGSWAGAMGFCQFLPSSLQRCGVAADGTGPVDLFTHDDAIFSIACYLKKSGFKSRNRATWRRAVYSYNHSDAYVDTILTLANRY
jgi:membrane-bound lytic murein transglycosylase B